MFVSTESIGLVEQVRITPPERGCRITTSNARFARTALARDPVYVFEVVPEDLHHQKYFSFDFGFIVDESTRDRAVEVVAYLDWRA